MGSSVQSKSDTIALGTRNLSGAKDSDKFDQRRSLGLPTGGIKGGAVIAEDEHSDRSEQGLREGGENEPAKNLNVFVYYHHELIA